MDVGKLPAGGANNLDAVVHVNLADYDLSGLEEHPKQGYHLKLDVHAPGSKGADVKHKVFWVKGCAKPPKDAGKDCEPPPPPVCEPVCGDKKIEGDETCEDNKDKSGKTVACRADCTFCGDGIPNDCEECDFGTAENAKGVKCMPDCTLPKDCGTAQTF